MVKVLYIVRGLPSSGKTTFAKQLTSNVFEADHYFYDNDGNYNFVPSKIKEAHKECQEFVKLAMQSSISKIAVSNTFTQEWEMEPYMLMAKEFDYMVFTVVVENRHGNTNKHNVPDDVIDKMKKRFEIKL